MSPPVSATLNGNPVELPAASTVADVVARLCGDARGVAVAIDRQVVPRSEWAGTVVAEGAVVEVVTADAGG